MSKKLYVGNLSWSTSAEDLRTLFQQFGEVEDAFIPSDRETGRSRGFGFVTLGTDAADSAIRGLDGQEFMGRSIRVNEAQPANSGGGGGFREGGGRGGYGGGGY